MSRAAPIPVGVTVARKHHQALRRRSGEEQLLQRATETPTNHSVDDLSDDNSWTSPSDSVGKQGGNTSWHLFLEASLIYLACVFLPSLLGFLMRFYQDYREASWQSEMALQQQQDDATEISWMEYVTGMYDFARQETQNYLCASTSTTNALSGSSSSSYSSYWTQMWGDMIGENSWFCASLRKSHQLESARMFLWSPDAQWTDLGTVAFLSLALAIIRIFILLAIVPLQEPNRLSAVIRCKSVHLLSRDYQLTPNGTPIVTRKAVGAIRGAAVNNMDGLMLPDLTSNSAQTSSPQRADYSASAFSTGDDEVDDGSGNREEDASADLGLSLDDSQHGVDDDQQQQQHDATTATTDSLASPPPPPPQQQQPVTPDAVEFLSDLDESKMSLTVNDRVEGYNSAPRLATASFRLIYSGLAAAIAFYYFSSYEFWPMYVGGKGHTAECWDLSGGISVGGVDGDFDAHNTALRLYYLHQSAYHWHSGAFHLLSVLLLLTRPSGKRLGWFRDSTVSYKRSFLQHAVAILLLSTTYVFSSLRRLGAIGMFSFDVSSFFLHLLQVCMNAPKGTVVRSARWINFLYRFMVLPSFFYCRFIVWPILWWSALTESGKWLNQLDRILFPGASIMLQTLWHVCMAGAMLLNLVYLRRLLNHPHLSRIYRSRKLERDFAMKSSKTW